MGIAKRVYVPAKALPIPPISPSTAVADKSTESRGMLRHALTLPDFFTVSPNNVEENSAHVSVFEPTPG